MRRRRAARYFLLVWALGCAFDPYVPECDAGERLEQGAEVLHCVPDNDCDEEVDEDCDTG